MSKLDEDRISYTMYNGVEVLFDDHYYNFFEKANKEIIISGMTNDLTKKIKEKIRENSDNYKKIKVFIDEL